MDRIVPPVHDTLFLRDGQLIKLKAVSELGIYSVFLGYNNEYNMHNLTY